MTIFSLIFKKKITDVVDIGKDTVKVKISLCKSRRKRKILFGTTVIREED